MVKGGRGRRAFGAVAIFLTAVALQQACTIAWAHATAASGTRYELSVVGLSRFDPPPDSPRTDCRWWPTYGNAELCAAPPRASDARSALRRAYPCLQIAMWLAILSLLLQTLRVPRSRLLQGAIPATSSVLVGVAITSMLTGAGDGLAVLAPLEVRFDAAGFMLALLAVVLSAASAVMVLLSFDESPAGQQTAGALPGEGTA